MVSLNVDTQVAAKVQGSEDQEKYPIVAKIKGTGKDGDVGVQVSGDDKNPISLAPISLSPITVIPDLKLAAESVDFKALISSISKLTEGVKISISNQNENPIAIALGKIPVDLTISVYSPANDQVFKVEIKGTVGGK
jgi:hypothetical protein